MNIPYDSAEQHVCTTLRSLLGSLLIAQLRGEGVVELGELVDVLGAIVRVVMLADTDDVLHDGHVALEIFAYAGELGRFEADVPADVAQGVLND